MATVKVQCVSCARELEFVTKEEYEANLGADDAPGILCLECRPRVVVDNVR